MYVVIAWLGNLLRGEVARYGCGRPAAGLRGLLKAWEGTWPLEAMFGKVLPDSLPNQANKCKK